MGMNVLYFLWNRDMGICQLCFRSADIRDCSVDHIIPVAEGGRDDRDNLQLSHKKCNNKKGDNGFTEKRPNYHYHKQHGKCASCNEPLGKQYDKVRMDKTIGWVPSNVSLMHKDCRVAYNSQFDGRNQNELKELCNAE
jgi:5-methylcytosine-specific restriction endonuclease McrA